MRVPVELVGARVARTAFDHQVRILFTGHGPDGRVRLEAELVIETALSLTGPDDSRALLTPGTGTRLAPLLGLFTRIVTAVEVTGRGTLSLGFDDGTGLGVDPDPVHESWGLTGFGFDPVLVGPGGEAGWRR
ncbi:DUF6188 family protein [Nocardiopsis dassonvillei]|uniref:DUF6188 family protein n=1 Tax=Nocardiopsis dassonvillei TaxID=2014 RepID=UPI00102C98A5|nr:DUF6188 family protein [Nocardiopsis dassonvillei]MCP3014819.1 DUF6188 family protein [Nocardiopsis dassonvillei]